MRIEHDNSGDFPAWHLQQLSLTDKDTEVSHKLFVNRLVYIISHMVLKLPYLRSRFDLHVLFTADGWLRMKMTTVYAESWLYPKMTHFPVSLVS